MTHHNGAVGAFGERLARQYLEEDGYQILATNWRCSLGELDLVALDRAGTLASVEVKTRTSDAYGTPATAVTHAKLARLRRLTAAYLREHPHRGPVRVDVIAVLVPRTGAPRLDHLRGVTT